MAGIRARVFKISEDAGTRLTWLKVTGGVLHVKDVLPGGEKADALRLYNGGKFRLVSEALPGMVVAAAGPVSTRPGAGAWRGIRRRDAAFGAGAQLPRGL